MRRAAGAGGQEEDQRNDADADEAVIAPRTEGQQLLHHSHLPSSKYTHPAQARQTVTASDSHGQLNYLSLEIRGRPLEQDAAFVCQMEQVLEVYKRSYGNPANRSDQGLGGCSPGGSERWASTSLISIGLGFSASSIFAGS